MNKNKKKIIIDVDEEVKVDIYKHAKALGLPVGKYLISLHESAKHKRPNLIQILYGDNNEK